MDDISIRAFKKKDWSAVWNIVKPVFQDGETYAFSPDMTEPEACRIWTQLPEATFVAEDAQKNIVGTYYLKPNQPSLGAHVCNCGYIVDRHARNLGVASRMCDHSQQEALSRNFRAMQYNLVVSTNKGAVRLWQKHGFEIVGILPGAFFHHRLGFVDAFVMYKRLMT